MEFGVNLKIRTFLQNFNCVTITQNNILYDWTIQKK